MRVSSHDVIIIGGGVVGASIAWHLCDAGLNDILILEREQQPGAGSTARANGGIRAQFTTRVNIELSLLSMDILDMLEDDIGNPPVYHKAGYLFFTADEERFSAMREAAAFQRKHSVGVEVLAPGEIRRHGRYFRQDDLVGGTFHNRDGFVDPGGLCNWFIRRAANRGARLQCGAEVRDIDYRGERFRLETSRGSYECERLVIAAGAWSGELCHMLDVSIPVKPVRRQLILSGRFEDAPAMIPMTIDADSGILIRREGSAMLIAWSNDDEPPGFNTEFDDEFIFRFAEALEHRFPAIADSGFNFRHSWAGLYCVTPDHHAILDGGIGGMPLYLATGFSGHGVMHSPATGKCMSEYIISGRTSSADVSPLSLERFRTGGLIHETMVL